jgi:hypothetical protein
METPMGYRSQVGLIFTHDLLPYFLMKISAKHRESLSEWADTWEMPETDVDVAKIHFDWVKWYSDDPEVQAFENALAFFQELERWDDFAFVRLGEDLDDSEEIGSLDGLYINRKIEFE